MTTTTTITSTLRTVRIQAKVAGADPRLCEFSSAGAHYLPTVVTVEYVRYGLQDWQVNSVTLSGLRLKKNGTPGQQRHDERFFGGPSPGWVREFISTNMPAVTS